MKDATLCYIFNQGNVLLQKKSNEFGEGKWNAPGGKLKFAETPRRAARREVREGTGLNVKSMKNVGLLNFMDEKHVFSVHIFVTEDFSGELRNLGEGKLQWFAADALPYKDMWESDSLWLPHILKGKAFKGDFMYSKGFKKLVKYQVDEIQV